MIGLFCIVVFSLFALVVARFHSSRKVHAFYYLWYGTPTVDGEYKHWNHEVLPHWESRINQLYPDIGKRFEPPNLLHSPFYPHSGPYSSSDPSIIQAHFVWLIESGVSVIVISWWGQSTKDYATDTQGVNTDRTAQTLFKIADQYNKDHADSPVSIAFHLEPYPSRSAESVREDIVYLHQVYGSFQSLYRDSLTRKPMFYVYDSYHILPYQWKRVLTPEGDMTIRGTSYDGIFLGLLLHSSHGGELHDGGFDGIYTYFATDGFSYGSTLRNWKSICNFCKSKDMLCSLSVGPGYNDSLIRPWNSHNSRSRENGNYYRRMWQKALDSYADFVSITSFNEWGEGTQIEPAVALETLPRTYLEYKDNDPYQYLNITSEYVKKFEGAETTTSQEL